MTNISVSEINSFLRCRRAWDLTSNNRQSLRHKVTPKIYFMIGSAVHEAIDAQASGRDPYEAFQEFVDKEYREREQAYREAVGSAPWESEVQEFQDSADLAERLVRQYFDHYGAENPLQALGLKYVATEVSFTIPLENGTNFEGTFDGILTDIATESKFYLIENKTYSQKPNMEVVQFGNQYVGYNWAFRELTGFTPAGTLFNGIKKNLIQSPKVLKSGALSQDKQARVTVKSFIEAMQEGGHDPVDYLAYLEYLEERERNGDERFFYREMFTYSNTQLDNWYQDTLKPIVWELSEPHKEIGIPLAIYPNKTSCEHCLVKDICQAMDLGEDVAGVVSQRYQVGKSPTREAVDGATKVKVSSSSELIEYLKAKANNG